MSTDVPDWVRSDCRLWGRQKRRVWAGHDWHGNVDGYAQSLLGRIREERDGASQGLVSQKWPEVYWGNGLDVQRSLLGMPERQHAVLHFQYVWDPDWGITADRRAGYLGIKRTEYFALVDRCETWVHARLEARVSTDAQVVEAVNKIIRDTLRTAGSSAINSQTRESCPSKINLSALHRPKVSLQR